MKYKIDENDVMESLEILFDMFDEDELEELDILDSDGLALSTVAAIQYAETIYPFVCKNMMEIPVNIVSLTKSKKSILSKNKVSAIKGCPILYISKTKEEDKDFDVSAYMELWLLEDGRFAEITAIQFETEEYVVLRREFKRIVKRKSHLFFSLGHLEAALETIEMDLLIEQLQKEGNK